MATQLTRRAFEKLIGLTFAGAPIFSLSCAPRKSAPDPSKSAVPETSQGDAIRMTRGKADLQTPPGSPPEEKWRYGLAFPFQVTSEKAALFCNLRGKRGHDFEVGTDIILFDDLANIQADRAFPLSRNHDESNPNSVPPRQPSILVKYPARGGFVPLGAKRADGSPHPHAGTGFGICQAAAWTADRAHPYQGAEAYEYLELYQLAYDDMTLRIVSSERIFYKDLFPGRTITNPGLANAIPDGDDLLFAMSENVDSAGTRSTRAFSLESPGSFTGSGVTRWKRTEKGWRVASFAPIAEAESTFEPSLVRDTNGSLLFCARGRRDPDRNDIRVWRSEDGGQSWRKIIHMQGVVSGAPICMNRMVDGNPYVAANLYEVLLAPVAERFRPVRDSEGKTRGGGRLREKLCLWPLNSDRTGLEPPIVVRDGRSEFGPPPSGGTWWIDHPSGMTVRLADGQWHSVIVIRICDGGEVQSNILSLPNDPTTPESGTYVEEVISDGKALPVWNF